MKRSYEIDMCHGPLLDLFSASDALWRVAAFV